MHAHPTWRTVLVAAVIAICALYALPNLFGEDPSVQVSPARGAAITEFTQTDIERALETVQLTPKAIARSERSVLVRLADEESQLRAQEVIKTRLGEGYVVALNLAPRTPAWLVALGARPMTLGLDLRGGVHFLMEMDRSGLEQQFYDRTREDIRSLLTERRIRDVDVVPVSGGLLVTVPSEEARGEVRVLLAPYLTELDLRDEQSAEGKPALRLDLKPQTITNRSQELLTANLSTLRNRVNELGVAEPIVQQQGASRVVVQLPGVQDTAFAKNILGATATLEYRAVDQQADISAALDGRVPPTSRLYRDRQNNPVVLKKQVIVSGDQLVNATSGYDEQGSPMVSVTLNSVGAERMLRFTQDNVGKPMAVLYIEERPETRDAEGKVLTPRKRVEEVISVATIRGVFSSRFQTTGLDSPQEAQQLALLLRAGALAAPMSIVEERTVGPSMGRENIAQGFNAVLFGMAILGVFVVVYYRLFGLFAVVTLGFNLVVLVSLLSVFGATLTMPGIAGIVLTIGMAIDANVLIYERIREELRLGNSPHAAIVSGFDKAFSAIADANITTLIAGIVLFTFGTGPVKGFAVTLSLGILTTLFTAVLGTRAIVALTHPAHKRLKSVSI